MENHGICLAERLLDGTGISLLDAARLIKNAIDFNSTSRENLKYCRDVIECGRSHLGAVEKYVTLFDAFWRYAEAKKTPAEGFFPRYKISRETHPQKGSVQKVCLRIYPGAMFQNSERRFSNSEPVQQRQAHAARAFFLRGKNEMVRKKSGI